MLIGVHQSFLENLVWVDDVIILMLPPLFEKWRHFFDDVTDVLNFVQKILNHKIAKSKWLRHKKVLLRQVIFWQKKLKTLKLGTFRHLDNYKFSGVT